MYRWVAGVERQRAPSEWLRIISWHSTLWRLGIHIEPAIDQIACPRAPSHGMVTRRWLPLEEREMLTKVSGDVFEIDCKFCGSYEYQPPDNPASAN
jgi:hypothetical protein